MEVADMLRLLQPDESATSFYQRIAGEAVRCGLPFVDQHVRLRPGVVLEVSGPHGSGKSEVLIQVAAAVLMGPHQQTLSPGHVLYLDLDGKMDYIRLFSVLTNQAEQMVRQWAWQQQQQQQQRQFQQGQQQPQMPHIPHPHEVVEQCLARFHLVTCHSSFELLAVLATLGRTLETLKATGGVKMLLIDNIAAFQWQDKACRSVPLPMAPPGASHAQSKVVQPALTFYNVHQAMAAYLNRLAQQYRLPIIVTKHTTRLVLDHESSVGMRLANWEVMAAPWHAFVTHRLSLHPAPAPAPEVTRIMAKWQSYAAPQPVFSLIIDGTRLVEEQAMPAQQHGYG